MPYAIFKDDTVLRFRAGKNQEISSVEFCAGEEVEVIENYTEDPEFELEFEPGVLTKKIFIKDDDGHYYTIESNLVEWDSDA